MVTVRPDDPRPQPGLTEVQVAELRGSLSQAVFHCCPGWLSTSAEDIVQAALLKIIEALREREGNPHITPFYVKRTAFCAVVDEIRRRRRLREQPMEESELIAIPAAVTGDSPESAARDAQLSRGVRDCLAALPDPRRVAVTMHLQGHSLAEVARLLEWTQKRAENLVYRGLADLRHCLTAKGLAP